MRHCERDALPTKVANGPAVHGKVGELAEDEPIGTLHPLGHRHAGCEGVSPTPADGSDAASLPTEWGKEQQAPGVLRRAWGSRCVDAAPH